MKSTKRHTELAFIYFYNSILIHYAELPFEEFRLSYTVCIGQHSKKEYYQMNGNLNSQVKTIQVLICSNYEK